MAQGPSTPDHRESRPGDRESRPIDRDTRPVDRDTRPIDRDTRPIERDNRPLDKETHPIAAETRPIDRESRPVDRDTRPIERDNRPLDRETHPGDRESRPLDPALRPGVRFGAALSGWIIAAFTLVVLTAIVGGVLGGVTYSLGSGEAANVATQNSRELGIGAAVTGLVLMFISYFAGGYVAGRMVRVSGVLNGAMTAVVGLVIAVILGVVGLVAGSRFADQLLNMGMYNIGFDSATLTGVGLISALVVFLVMVAGGALGGLLGGRYHHKVRDEYRTTAA